MEANYVRKMGKDMNRFFTKKDIPITNKHVERCSTLLATREVQFKTTKGYHYQNN